MAGTVIGEGLTIEGDISGDEEIVIHGTLRGRLTTSDAVTVGGTAVVAVGSGFYIGSGLGAGPRDGLMVGLNERFGWSIRASRTIIEIVALIVGWALGGRIGFGTIFFAVTIGPLAQIAADGLSQRLFPRREVEHVVDQLERHPEVPGEFAELFFELRFGPASNRAQLRAGHLRKQARQALPHQHRLLACEYAHHRRHFSRLEIARCRASINSAAWTSNTQ